MVNDSKKLNYLQQNKRWVKMNLSYLLFLVSAAALEPNACISCKHFIKMGYGNHAKCKRFPIIIDIMHEVDYGYIKNEYTDYNYCSAARTFGFMCGEKGKYYEKIELFTSEEKMDKNEPN